MLHIMYLQRKTNLWRASAASVSRIASTLQLLPQYRPSSNALAESETNLRNKINNELDVDLPFLEQTTLRHAQLFWISRRRDRRSQIFCVEPRLTRRFAGGGWYALQKLQLPFIPQQFPVDFRSVSL